MPFSSKHIDHFLSVILACHKLIMRNCHFLNVAFYQCFKIEEKKNI